MKKLFLLLLAATAQASTLPLYIDTATNAVVSPDAPTTVAGYGIADDTNPHSVTAVQIGVETAGGGGSVGFASTSTDGFAGGFIAVASGNGTVQLGTGSNGTNNTIQFRDSGSVTAAEFGQLASNVTTVTATTYTALVADGAILASNAAGVAITLPAAASVPSNYRLSIVNIGASGAITVDGDITETINGELTIILTTQYESVTLVADGSNWFIL